MIYSIINSLNIKIGNNYVIKFELISIKNSNYCWLNMITINNIKLWWLY
jgi:hypothetical protein